MDHLVNSIETSWLATPRKKQILYVLGNVLRGKPIRNGLFEHFLRPNLINRDKWHYIPLFRGMPILRYSPRLTEIIESEMDNSIDSQWVANLFCNVLALSPDFDTDGFDVYAMTPPSQRIVNGGFLVVTLEVDAAELAELEHQMAACVAKGKGRPQDSPLAMNLHRPLTKYADYRGLTAIWSGNKSVHIHIVFDTSTIGLELAELGLADERHIWMREVHQATWDDCAALLVESMPEFGKPDSALRRYTQPRRLPYGVRRLHAENLIGLPEGSEVMQVPLLDLVRVKRPQGTTDRFLRRPDPVKLRNAPRPTATFSSEGQPYTEDELDGSLPILRDWLREEWGSDFPAPTWLTYREGQPYLFFFNHEHDRKPSTFVRGDHRQVLLQGRNAPEGNFFLPHGNDLNELLDQAVKLFRTVQSNREHDDKSENLIDKYFNRFVTKMVENKE